MKVDKIKNSNLTILHIRLTKCVVGKFLLLIHYLSDKNIKMFINRFITHVLKKIAIYYIP